MQDYNNTDRQLHQLCQEIAKVNRTYVPKKDDDSHTNLYFDSIEGRVIGRWITSPEFGKVILTLNLSNLQFEWQNSSNDILESVDPVNKYQADVENEISVSLQKLGLNPDGFSNNLHYEIPDYSFIKDKINPISANSLNMWKHYREMANNGCSHVLGLLQKDAEIRIWPHHFDTGIYVPLDKVGIGFGLAMEDSMVGDSYFYISGYPLKGEIDYKGKPSLKNGIWEIGEHWKGAFLTLSKLNDTGETLTNFINSTLGWFQKL